MIVGRVPYPEVGEVELRINLGEVELCTTEQVVLGPGLVNFGSSVNFWSLVTFGRCCGHYIHVVRSQAWDGDIPLHPPGHAGAPPHPV